MGWRSNELVDTKPKSHFPAFFDFDFGCRFGGTILSIVRWNRSQPSGSVSISSGFGFLGGFAMSQTEPSANLPTQTFAAIGRVMVLWSHMQAMMDVAIYSMLGTKPSKGAWITAPLRYNARMDILKSVGWNFFRDDEKLRKAFQGHLTEINNCYADRNKIDHALWWHFGTDTMPSIRVRVTAKAISPPDVQTMTAKEIRAIATRIHDEMHALNDFLEAHTPPPPT